jgi:plastocyanin
MRLCFAPLCLMLLTAPAFAGAVTGTVRYEGEVPNIRPVQMQADAACAAMHGEPVPNEVIVLGDGQTMGNILVWVSGGLPEGAEYPVPEEAAVLDQEGCIYHPRVFAVQVGQTLRVLNPDGILHNVNGAPKANRPFNVGMTASVTEMDMVFDNPELEPFPIRCDVHTWMRSFCGVFDHPYFFVTDASGEFRIEGLAPGEYEITAWHEILGPQTATITIPDEDDAEVTADFEFSRPSR